MATNVYYNEWGTIVLAPGAQTTWWFTWGFRSHQWTRFDASPQSDNSKVEIVRQWAEKDIHGGISRLVTFRNNGSTPVAFRPKALTTPW